MDEKAKRESAVIHRFPPGGRAAPRSGGSERKDKVVIISSGRGWYHDVAIRDAEDAERPKPRG